VSGFLRRLANERYLRLGAIRQIHRVVRFQGCGVPLDPNVREGGDAGKPIVVNKAEAVAAQALNQIARQVAARISVINLEE